MTETYDMSRMLEKMGPINVGAMPVALAKDIMKRRRLADGYAETYPLLTEPDHNSKLAKGDEINYSLALAPHESSGTFGVCRHSTPGCRIGCVASSGNGTMPTVIRGRAWKTRFLGENPQAFVTVLADEIARAVAKHDSIAVRLNAFSDLRWERICPDLFDMFPDVQFYDYTKWPSADRWATYTGMLLPQNYHLTYSHAGDRPNGEQLTRETLNRGHNVAVVFDTKRTGVLPETWFGCPVVDGDKSDARYNDQSNVVVGLRAKGRAQRDQTGFVVKVEADS